MPIDPVCHMEVAPEDAADSSKFQGQTYYFCGAGCKRAFDRDPGRFLTGTAGSAAEHHQLEGAGAAPLILKSYPTSTSSQRAAKAVLATPTWLKIGLGATVGVVVLVLLGMPLSWLLYALPVAGCLLPHLLMGHGGGSHGAHHEADNSTLGKQPSSNPAHLTSGQPTDVHEHKG